MSICAHDPYCPGYGYDHDIWRKTGFPTAREGRHPGESIQAFKRRERAERKARADRWDG